MWPQGTEQAKAAFLPKEGCEQGHLMAYRLLLIMAALYRKWAAITLTKLGGWTELWAKRITSADVGAQGAEDARYLAALDLE